jgi:hypothetical protein
VKDDALLNPAENGQRIEVSINMTNYVTYQIHQHKIQTDIIDLETNILMQIIQWEWHSVGRLCMKLQQYNFGILHQKPGQKTKNKHTNEQTQTTGVTCLKNVSSCYKTIAKASQHRWFRKFGALHAITVCMIIAFISKLSDKCLTWAIGEYINLFKKMPHGATFSWAGLYKGFDPS